MAFPAVGCIGSASAVAVGMEGSGLYMSFSVIVDYGILAFVSTVTLRLVLSLFVRIVDGMLRVLGACCSVISRNCLAFLISLTLWFDMVVKVAGCFVYRCGRLMVALWIVEVGTDLATMHPGVGWAHFPEQERPLGKMFAVTHCAFLNDYCWDFTANPQTNNNWVLFIYWFATYKMWRPIL